MTIVKGVLDAINAVSKGIENMQRMSKAIKTGKDYLKTQHPDVAIDLAIMCDEMRKSSNALASASSIVTDFRFVVGDAQPNSALQFNRIFSEHKEKAGTVEQVIDSMCGHCRVITTQRKSPRKWTQRTPFPLILAQHSNEREQDLAKALQEIYDEEMEYHNGVVAMADVVKATLKAVQDELGPPGIIDPNNVPDAGVVLGEYATAFSKLETRCKSVSTELQEIIDALWVRPS